MKLPGKADEIAVNRFQLIAPFLSKDLDSAKSAEVKKKSVRKAVCLIEPFAVIWLAIERKDLKD